MAKQIFDDQEFTQVRLPSEFVPERYELSLKPDLDKFTFGGTVKVKFASSKPLQNIVLHANELTIHEGFVQCSLKKTDVSTLVGVIYGKETETAKLVFDNGIPQDGTLFLEFSGILNDKMKGFYRTAYKVGEFVEYAATTQFEATDARRCFPCVDEPDRKAVFSVSLTFDPLPKRLSPISSSGEVVSRRIALSNERQIAVHENNNEVTVSFADTPKMSTYLLAFCVGEFEKVETKNGNRPICVYTTPGKKEHGRFALEVACKSLTFYEEYFGIKYPLTKMDLVAIPDFANGAMENWGLVTYRETCLLVDPNNTSTATKQYVAIVVAHELAHQWFGNLVTMEWWTHLWLNEGFASFMEFLCVDHIFPEYDIWSQFVTDVYARALELDSLHNSHPIEVPVNHPSEIDEIFDAISYSKGASVIRMLYNYIGDAQFRKGMNEYLNKFSYKNACTEDLWASLEAASNKPICKFMSGWTSQKGFPWLSVTSTIEGNNAKLTLTQSKFTADGRIAAEDADVSWLIPVGAISGSEPTRESEINLFEGKTGTIIVEGVGDSWVKLNPGTVSLYRTVYPKDVVGKLYQAIRDQTLPPMDRLGLQNDCFALCQAGKVTTVDLLKLLEAFKGETEYTIWCSIDNCLGKLNILLANTDFQDKFHVFGRKLYSDIFNKLTWTPQENEKHTDAMTRSIIINRLISFAEQSVVEEAKRRFKAQLECGEMIPADLRGAVYKAASIYGDDESFEALFNIYRTNELHEEKNRAARALGFAKDPTRLQRAVNFALSDEVRNQDKVFVFMPIGMTNPPVAWKLLQDNKDMFREKYETGNLMTRLIRIATENFASEEKAREIAMFFEENKFPGAERTIQQSLETIRLNSNWLARDSEAIKTFLS